MRCVVIVLDSLGVGELPDAASYGDVGSNTLKSAVLLGKAKLPNMSAMAVSYTHLLTVKNRNFYRLLNSKLNEWSVSGEEKI